MTYLAAHLRDALERDDMQRVRNILGMWNRERLGEPYTPALRQLYDEARARLKSYDKPTT